MSAIDSLRDELEAFRNGERRDWGQIRYYVDMVAARLAEAERERAAADRYYEAANERAEAAEERVAALEEALREADNGVLRACQLLPMTYSLAKPSDATSHVEEAAIRLRQIVLPGIRAALAAADRPEGTP